jgi:Bacterial PH domain
MKRHPAPWGKLLIGMSLFASLICVGVAVLMWSRVEDLEAGPYAAWIAMLPLAVMAFSALFMIRGYVVTADEILIERPLWSTHFARNQLQSAVVDPAVLRGSIRLFGNGGFFSFTGVFQSRKLGRYRAFVTDPARCVILRFSNRVVVVSPADPEAFIRDVMNRR